MDLSGQSPALCARPLARPRWLTSVGHKACCPSSQIVALVLVPHPQGRAVPRRKLGVHLGGIVMVREW